MILGLMIYSNQVKREQVVYLPFDLSGKQMATTIPPFGIFIEKEFKNEGVGKGSI